MNQDYGSFSECGSWHDLFVLTGGYPLNMKAANKVLSGMLQ